MSIARYARPRMTLQASKMIHTNTTGSQAPTVLNSSACGECSCTGMCCYSLQCHIPAVRERGLRRQRPLEPPLTGVRQRACVGGQPPGPCQLRRSSSLHHRGSAKALDQVSSRPGLRRLRRCAPERRQRAALLRPRGRLGRRQGRHKRALVDAALKQPAKSHQARKFERCFCLDDTATLQQLPRVVNRQAAAHVHTPVPPWTACYTGWAENTRHCTDVDAHAPHGATQPAGAPVGLSAHRTEAPAARQRQQRGWVWVWGRATWRGAGAPPGLCRVWRQPPPPPPRPPAGTWRAAPGRCRTRGSRRPRSGCRPGAAPTGPPARLPAPACSDASDTPCVLAQYYPLQCAEWAQQPRHAAFSSSCPSSCKLPDGLQVRCALHSRSMMRTAATMPMTAAGKQGGGSGTLTRVAPSGRPEQLHPGVTVRHVVGDRRRPQRAGQPAQAPAPRPSHCLHMPG